MISRSRLACRAFLLLYAGGGPALPSQSAPQDYRPVNSSELLGGYVPDGEWIETTGHVWFSGDGVFLNASQPSAHVPIRIDVTKVDSDTVRRLELKCGAPSQFSGGCGLAVRGRTATLGDGQGVLASDLREPASSRQ